MATRKTHGMSKLPEYRTWASMKTRCFLRTDPSYRNYGGRGITICARWRASFPDFHADMGDRPGPEYSIDRIDNEGGYWCGKCWECVMNGRDANCRWATRIEQSNNKRNNHPITAHGRTLNIGTWAALGGPTETTIKQKIRKGFDPDAVIDKPRNLAGRALVALRAPGPSHCEECSEPLPGGTHRRYCSGACRSRAYRWRKASATRERPPKETGRDEGGAS